MITIGGWIMSKLSAVNNSESSHTLANIRPAENEATSQSTYYDIEFSTEYSVYFKVQ